QRLGHLVESGLVRRHVELAGDAQISRGGDPATLSHRVVLVELQALRGRFRTPGGDDADMVAGAPLEALHRRDGAPDLRMWLLEGSREDRDAVIVEVLTMPGEGDLLGPGLDDEVVRLLLAPALLLR